LNIPPEVNATRLTLTFYPGLLTPAFVTKSYSTNMGEGLKLTMCIDIPERWVDHSGSEIHSIDCKEA